MDTSTFELLCEASQLSFADAEKERFMRTLDSMIEFCGVVERHDSVYDLANDFRQVTINDLRWDFIEPSYPPEKLLENTEPLFDCCVIPKMMD